ncbi:MAG: hypothetical protein AABM31_12550 [Actinomycetota bacterium]
MTRTRTAAAAFATARLAYGVALLIAPERVASGWLAGAAEQELQGLLSERLGNGAADAAVRAGHEGGAG